MAEKWILAPPGKRGKNGRKMGQKWPFSHFLAIFPLLPGGAKIHFLAIFFPFRAGGPIWGLYRAIGIATQEKNYTNICGYSLLKYTERGDKTSQYSYLVAILSNWVPYNWVYLFQAPELSDKERLVPAVSLEALQGACFFAIHAKDGTSGSCHTPL